MSELHLAAPTERRRDALGVISLGIAVAGMALALVGTVALASPLYVRELPEKSANRHTLFFAATYFLPLLLGGLATLLGAITIHRIGEAEKKISGSGPSVFAIMVGAFTIMIAFVDIFAGLIW